MVFLLRRVFVFAAAGIILLFVSACSVADAPVVSSTPSVAPSLTTVPTVVLTPSPIITPTAEVFILQAKLLRNFGNSALVADLSNEAICFVSLKDVAISADHYELRISDLSPGMLLDISYDGILLESYPLQLNSATEIVVTGKEFDLTGFYASVIEDLYAERAHFAIQSKIIAVNLEDAQSLTPLDRDAVTYLLSLNLSSSIDVIAGNYEYLVDTGYINDDDLEFPNGVLIEIKDTGLNGDTLLFDMSKWHSGLTSLSYTGCSVVFTDDGWDS